MRARRALLLCLLGASFLAPVAAALFKVWVREDTVQLGYQLSEREHARRALRNEVRQLEIELAAETSPARLLQLAQKLDLRPTPPAALPMSSGTTTTAAKPPKAHSPKARGGTHGRP